MIFRTPNSRLLTWRKFLATTLLVCFTTITTYQENAYAGSGSSSAGGGGLPSPMRAIESFQPDLSTGRATMGIPIAVPPGRHGVQPSVGLSYSSSAKNGPIGVGWMLELGSIERSTRWGMPHFDSSDTFALKFGGVNADLGEITPGEFRMKDEQLFAKILLSGTSWTLTTKDGTVATFGATTDSQQTTSRGTVAWFLNKVQDIQGNTMTIRYTNVNRQIYPASIQYTSHPATGLLPLQEVKFIWQTRPDLEWDQRFGDRITTDQRLSAIEVTTSNTLVRRYVFAYTTSPITNRSLLSSVTQIGSDGQTSLPPIQMNDSNSWAGWWAVAGWNDLASWGTFRFVDGNGQDTGFRMEDVDGDGRADLMIGQSGYSQGWVNQNNQNGFQRQPGFAPPLSFLTSDNRDAGGRFADLNGDGRIDLYYGRGNGSPTEAGYLNNGLTWNRSDVWNALPGYGSLEFVNGQAVDNGLRFIDLDGDGKSDVLLGRPEQSHAWRNTGSGWVQDDRWAVPKNFTNSSGLDLGCRFVDINGDGLVDLFYAGPEEQAVYLNTGAGWQRETAWNTGPLQGVSFLGTNGEDQGWRFLDVNGDGLTDLVQAKQGSSFQTLLNTGTGWTSDNRFALPAACVSSSGIDLGVRFGDLNGDGMTDILQDNAETHQGWLWTNQSNTTPATPPDLLVQVNNGVGGTTTTAYLPSTLYDNLGGDSTYDLPFVTQTVSSQTINNGMGWSATTRYTYFGGQFDPTEREFLGFAYAKVTDPQNSTAESWFHQDTHLKGHPYKQQTHDASGNLYAQVDNSWACTSLFPLTSGHVHFCHLASTTSTVYDGDSTFKQTRASYTYDSNGNVISQVQEGDTAVSGDEITSTTDYTLNPTLWLMGFPSHAVVTDASGNKLSESWITYDGNSLPTDPPTRGLITKAESWLSTGTNPIGTATYDTYGNKLTSTDSLNRTTTTTYDPQATFPIQVKNHMGHLLTTTYEPSTGNILTTTDPNNQTTTNTYDPLGRLIAVIGPNDTSSSPSVTYAYDLSSVPTRVTKQVKFTPNSSLLTPNTYTSYAFADGLGRTIQTRSPAKDSAKQIVTGNVEFGTRGQVAAQYLPYSELLTPNYSPPTPDLSKTLYQYDPVGRMIQITEPDGAVTRTSYSDWTVTLTDARGNTTTKESDAYGRLIKVTESATSDHPSGITLYTYDPSGRLTKVTDAKGNTTAMTYDSLGRKLTMTDPDMGAWSYAYDLGGNLISQTDARKQILDFTYDALNRLMQKKGRFSATATPIILATYSYDTSSKPNTRGRLSKVTDPSGSTEFFYDNLGRETKTIKIIIGTPSFTVQREYDPLNRLTRLIYPDNTDLRYEYSCQGISRIYSVNADSSTVDYLTNADFNAAGETLKLQLGNGDTTDYNYDPQTLRISSIRTTNSQLQTLQDLAYTFDSIGNLTNLTDRWNSATQNFQYDALNRLTGANGSYGSWAYRFDALGNLLQKDTSATLTYGKTTGTPIPHAVTKKVSGQDTTTLVYDANGNLTAKGTQSFTYDLQNRLTKVLTPFGQPGSITLTLQPGWNCIGTPFLLKDSLIPNVLKGLTLGTDYDQVSKLRTPNSQPPWLSFVGDKEANETTDLDFGKGFWIHINKVSSVMVTCVGTTPAVSKTLSLAKGWNPIAAPNLTDTPVSSALQGLVSGTDYTQVKRWSAVNQSFDLLSATDVVHAGETLWVNMAAAKNWLYPTPIQRKTTTYTYDGDGGRVKMTTDEGGFGTYIGELYEALPSSVTRTHIFFGPTRLCTLERNPLLIASASPDSELLTPHFLRRAYASLKRFFQGIEETFVGTAYADITLPAGVKLIFFHGDHLGSINVVTDQTGRQLELSEYQPYGSFARKEGNRSLSTTSSRSAPSYTGKRLDDSTGLYYYGARYYDPDLGRFTQPDTIVQAPSDPQSLNRYTYVRNNPLIYTDPTGHKRWNPFRHLARLLGPIGRTIVSAVIAAAVFVVVAIASEGNIHLAAAAAAGAFSYTSTFLNASAQGASYFRAQGAATVNGVAAFAAVYFGYGANPFTAAAIGASIGAASGATSSAILGGDPGTGALSGAVGGATMAVAAPVFGMVGGAAAAGAASAAVSGGNVGQGALLGAVGAVTFLVASYSLQKAIDIARARGGVQADGAVANAVNESKTHSGYAARPSQQAQGALTVSVPSSLGVGIATNALFDAGATIFGLGMKYHVGPAMVVGGVMALGGLFQAFHDYYSVPATARTASQGIYEGTGLREHLDEIDQAGSGRL